MSTEHRHPDITDDMIAANPFVFLLNKAKLQMLKETGTEVLNLGFDFDLFNRRTQYPYDIIENPMKLDQKN